MSGQPQAGVFPPFYNHGRRDKDNSLRPETPSTLPPASLCSQTARISASVQSLLTTEIPHERNTFLFPIPSVQYCAMTLTLMEIILLVITDETESTKLTCIVLYRIQSPHWFFNMPVSREGMNKFPLNTKETAQPYSTSFVTKARMVPSSRRLQSILGLAFFLVAVNANVHRVKSEITSRAAANVIPPAQFSVSISGTAPRSNAKKELLKALRSSSASAARDFTSPIAGSDFDEEYLTNLTIGGQDFALIVDTGSSDTWVAKQGFSCFDLSGTPVPTSNCAFGTDGFNTSASSTYSLIPNTNFNISYGDGEFLTGDMAFETLTIGGMTVPRQEIGIVTNAAWLGDGIDTGLMGLASPNLTSAFKGTNPNADEWPETQIPYNPLFYTAVKDGIVSEPYFSVALNRGSFEAENNSLYDPNLGVIAFGGIAPVPVTTNIISIIIGNTKW
ncbi:hypothetical protein D9757_010525 [Collybiopsis confluens]|uniref:Peptidase A1 domain-containing protein n=1 Tax=Collybiopsis confluens TaxID=2823264 RepID=A0A8H5GND6_9AGAR|nr:hypothetical protein D9757_010525 [Collybiopsis confluens]